MKKEDKKKIVIMFSILVVILIVLLVIIANIRPKEEITPETQIEITNKKINEIAINKLADMNEMERMKYYCNEFLDKIENKKYNDAYEMLNENFKNNFFKTYDEFEKYAKDTFPRTISAEYTNCERLGELYVVWLNIVDPLRSSKSEKVEIKMVIKENDLNSFELSFSVL